MPYVTYLCRDDVRNPPPSESNGDPGVQLLPTWEQVYRAILDLDNDKIRMVIISETAPEPDSGLPFGGTGMIIAGGPDAGYICEVFYETDWEIVRRAMRGDAEGVEVEIVRGAPTSYDRCYCHPREQILDAVQEFFDSGILTSKLHWETEPN